MNILVFSTAYEPFVGGAEVAVRATCLGCPDDSFTILTSIFGENLPRREQKGNIRIVRIGTGLHKTLDHHLYAFLAPLYAFFLNRSSKFDLAWAMMANQAGFAALLTRVFFGIPYLLSLQEGDSEQWFAARERLMGPLYPAMYKKATRVQVISTFLKKRALLLGAPEPVAVVPNAFDASAFAPATAHERSQVRTELGISESSFFLFTSSRLVEKNAVDVVIRSLTQLPDAVFVIAGSGELEAPLRSLAAELGVASRVFFLGTKSQAVVGRLTAAADVFVRPSRSEGLGISFLEAMACSVPVIATAVGGIPDILQDGVQGLVVPVDDPSAIASAVQRLSGDEHLRHRLGKQAHEFSKKFSWELIAKDMRAIFMAVSRS